MEESGEKWKMGRVEGWAAVGALLLGMGAAVVSGAMFSGNLEARVKALETTQTQSVPKGEWDLFVLDTQRRLDRIERKLDQQASSPSVPDWKK